MANNRLYLYCRHCNEALGLDKNFGGPYSIRCTIEDIEDFLAEHRFFDFDTCEYEHNIILCEEFGDSDSITGVELPDHAKFWSREKNEVKK